MPSEGEILGYVDGSWVDIGSLVVAGIYSGAKWCQRKKLADNVGEVRPPFFCGKSGTTFVTGLTLFPLVLLAAGPISTFLLMSVLNSSKITITIAAVVALFFILEKEAA